MFERSSRGFDPMYVPVRQSSGILWSSPSLGRGGKVAGSKVLWCKMMEGLIKSPCS